MLGVVAGRPLGGVSGGHPNFIIVRTEGALYLVRWR